MAAQVICVSNISVVKKASTLISELSLSISEAEHWVVFGPNGCGKTTLLSVLTGHVWASSGRVAILGNVLGRSDIRQIRKLVGRVNYPLQLAFQRADYLVSDVVASGFFDSIGMKFETPSKEQELAVNGILEKLDATQFRNRIFRELSYGEQKRILLARALVHSPKLLVLDEPYEGLDLVAKKIFFDCVRSLIESNRQLSTLWTTHHLDEIPEFCSKALLLKSGEQSYQGESQEAFSQDRLSSLFETEIQIVELGAKKLAMVKK